MAVERLRCLADGEGPLPVIVLRIELEPAHLHQRRSTLRPDTAPTHRVSANALWRMLKNNGERQWQAELALYRDRLPTIAERLEALVPADVRVDDDVALIRLGRFCNAASKTVPALAPGTVPPATKSYSLAETSDTEEPTWLPFGWIRLHRLRTRSEPPAPATDRSLERPDTA